LFWGAISSSGVPAAIVNFWKYFEAVRLFGPSKCVEETQDIVEFVDSILLDKGKARTLGGSLRDLFGFPNLTDDTAFAGAATIVGLGRWQSQNWDPELGTHAVTRYCGNITMSQQIYPRLAGRKDDLKRLQKLSGGDGMTDEKINKTLNYIGYLNLTVLAPCAAKGLTQQECFTPNMTWLSQDNLKAVWRSWAWQ
jgi:hypothetical protein